MKYLVMETHPAYAVLLDESGRFLKAANLHYQVGDTVQDIIELRPPQTRRRSFGRPLVGIAGLAACLCLAFFGYYQPNFMAYGTLRIQINPDVEMTVSRTERVLGLTGLNGDGQELIAGYSYQGKTREMATDELVERAIEMGYLSDGDTISITVSSSDTQWQAREEEQIQTQLEERYGETIVIQISAGDAADQQPDPGQEQTEVVVPVAPQVPASGGSPGQSSGTGAGAAYDDTDYGPNADGVTDYDDTDYGPNADGVTDYDDTDYGPNADGVTDYTDTDYGPNADGVTDYTDTDYGPNADGVTDYTDTDYGPYSDGVTDYEDRSDDQEGGGYWPEDEDEADEDEDDDEEDDEGDSDDDD